MIVRNEHNRPHGSVDTTACDREPIHIPGSIQPHGVLVVLSAADHVAIQVSANAGQILGVEVSDALGRPLDRLLGAGAATVLGDRLSRAPTATRPVLLGSVTVTSGKSFHAVAHRADGGIVLELETSRGPDELADVHSVVDAFTLAAEDASTTGELARLTSVEVRKITGFDRVLVYRFDDSWNGTVVGEDGSGRLPSLLDHRFPASDIPAQARELYRLNRVRIIPDADYRAVPLVPGENPATGKPLDMTFSTLRSVSPVHVEYMKNMETAASMSVSIIRGGKLWGLVACHHRGPKAVPFQVRTTCDLFARAFALRLSGLEQADDYQRRIEVREAYAKLLGGMADRLDFVGPLTDQAGALLAFAGSQGAAVLTEGGCVLLGNTPTEADVRALADWLFRSAKDEVYSTDTLPQSYPPARAFAGTAAGLLAVSISKLHPSYILWFRPEVVQTVKWGGNPTKPADAANGNARISPRRSFATWRETVREKSLAWKPSEIEGASELRNAVVGTVLRRAEELAELNAELTRSNRELEAFSYSVSHDLRAPLRHIVGYAEMLRDGAAGKLSARDERCIGTIIESSEFAGTLVDRLLDYSRMGQAELQRGPVDMNALVREVRKDVAAAAPGRTVAWRVAALPTVVGDLLMLRLAVRNLLDNALKYTRLREKAVVEVGYREDGHEHVFHVKDNGVGFDMRYADKLFGVFQRLHRMEEFEGTGIGLANVRRVMERHGGRAWADAEEGVGATLYFSLPKTRE